MKSGFPLSRKKDKIERSSHLERILEMHWGIILRRVKRIPGKTPPKISSLFRKLRHSVFERWRGQRCESVKFSKVFRELPHHAGEVSPQFRGLRRRPPEAGGHSARDDLEVRVGVSVQAAGRVDGQVCRRLHLLASRIGGQRPDAAQDPLEALRPLPPVGPDQQVHLLHLRTI